MYLVGSGVDIYIFAEGIQYRHKVFGGRASNGGFAPDKKCTRIGTELASLAAGEFVGVATKANVYRYGYTVATYATNMITCTYVRICAVHKMYMH